MLDIKTNRSSVDGPGSHHTGGTKLSGNEPFRDDGHMIKPGQGGSAGGYGAQGTPSDGYNSQKLPTTGSSGMHRGEQGMRTGEHGMRTGEQGYGNSGMQDTTTTGNKPSMMDKLNPKIDSNGDGKAGFMK